jgi:phosphonate transport system substrate-binding protein
MKWASLAFCSLALVLCLAAPVRAEPKPIRVGMIPDAGATQVSVAEKAPLKNYLAQALGAPVELVIPTNYNATVEALGNGSLDFAYLGGLTYIKARERYGVLPLAQRQSDREFHSLFVTRADSPIHALGDLKGRSFAFGDINSTSGHLMPYQALKDAGVDRDKDLRHRFTGGHPFTAKAVEAGLVDAGAMDESVYQAMVSSGALDASKLRVFYKTPPFVDYVWAARKDVDEAMQEKFRQAFLSLRVGPNDAILAILRGRNFVPAADEEYDALRKTAKELKLF